MSHSSARTASLPVYVWWIVALALLQGVIMMTRT